MKTYTVDYFINKFERIPLDKWCKGKFGIGTRHCALGHCGMRDTFIKATRESIALSELFQDNHMCITDVNDECPDLGSNPKERVLNALSLIASGALKKLYNG